MRKEGRSAATVNDAVKTIRTALTFARRNGVVLANVAEAESIRATFTPGQVRQLLAAAKGDWPGVIQFGWFTGASLRDITNLRWRQVDLAKGALSYARRKTGAGVIVPLHPELVEWLVERPSADDPEAFVFPSLGGRSAAGKSGLSMAFSAIMAGAGLTIDEEAPKGKAGRKRRALSFHCLRHSFVFGLANAGVGVEIRQALAGHASAEMNMNYTHREHESLREAMKELPGLKEAEVKVIDR